MEIQVKLFARAKEIAGSDSLLLTLPEQSTVADLKRQLGEQFPALRVLLPHLMVSIDSEFAFDEMVLNPQQEIACFPPVSGG